MIACILPTRGLAYTKVLESIERERRGYDLKIYYSYDKPIPDGHNELCKQALEDGADYLWMVEEDTVPTEGCLKKMLDAKVDIICVDYGINSWSCVTRDVYSNILWCGLGCTLVRRGVFEKLEYPYFRVDQVYRLNDHVWVQLPEEYLKKKNYGSLDIWFFHHARKVGYKINQLGGECEHLLLESLGERGKNHGLHTIITRPKINFLQVV